MPFVYIPRCADGSYYVGSTRSLATRVDRHNSGSGALYTSRRTPVEVVFAHECHRIDDAYTMEKRIQGWSRAKREALIDGRLNDLPALSKKDFRGRG